jgi:hypothetical protein
LLGTSVHYPGDGNLIYRTLTREQVAAKLRAYRNFHVNTRGWSDIGYQVAGDQSGRVWDLRGIDRVPAASASEGNPDANLEWGAFLFVIGNSETPTPALIRAFQDWRATRWLKRWPGKTQIRGHRQVPGASTSCPGSRTVTLIDNGTLAQIPSDSGGDDDMTPAEARKVLEDFWNATDSYGGETPSTVRRKWIGRYSFFALRHATYAETVARRAEVKIDALTAAVSALPEINSEELAAGIAAKLAKIDVDLKVTVRNETEEPAET